MTTDAYFSKVGLLIPFTGSNGSTSISDVSTNGIGITVNGGAQISTGINDPFGNNTGVGYFNGTNAYLAINNSANPNLLWFSNQEFAIEVWVYPTSFDANYTRLFHVNGDAYPGAGITVDPSGNSIAILSTTGGGFDIFATSTALTLNTWNYVKLQRVSNTIYLQVGTTRTSVGTITGSLYKPTSNLASGGQNGVLRPLHGYMSNLRVTIGNNRGTSTSVPTAAFPLTGKQVSITSFTETIAATNFYADMYDITSGALINRTTITSGTPTLNAPTDNAVFITIQPKQGNKWLPSTSYAVNDLVFPTNPITTPYYYKRVNAGTSSVTTEPTWTTTVGAQCDDGATTNAWECVDGFAQPVTIGPVVPV